MSDSTRDRMARAIKAAVYVDGQDGYEFVGGIEEAVDAVLAEMETISREAVNAGMDARCKSLIEQEPADARFKVGHRAMIRAIREGK